MQRQQCRFLLAFLALFPLLTTTVEGNSDCTVEVDDFTMKFVLTVKDKEESAEVLINKYNAKLRELKKDPNCVEETAAMVKIPKDKVEKLKNTPCPHTVDDIKAFAKQFATDFNAD
jgi:hypothetical protein